MPPKGTPKKAAAEPKVAAKSTPKATPKKDTAKATPAKATSPKKTKEPVKYTQLDRSNSTVPVDISFLGDLTQAKLLKSGSYIHSLKLEASAAFSLVKTYTITEGENEGQQIIVLKPAKAFQFEKLNPELRARVYKFYFASKGVVNSPVVFGDGKRKNTTDAYAKSYAAGDKSRVAILAVNKMIHAESIQIFYNHTFRMESTGVLMDFLAITSSINKLFLRRVEIKTYQKNTARNALAFLAEAKNLTYLKFDVGVALEKDVSKVVKTFWTDAHKLLEAVGGRLEKQMVDDVKPVKAAPAAEEEEDEEMSSEAEDEAADEDEEEQSGSDNEAGEDSESDKSEKSPQKSDTSDTAATEDSSEQQEVAKTQPMDFDATNTAVDQPHTSTDYSIKNQDLSTTEPMDIVDTNPTPSRPYGAAAIEYQTQKAAQPEKLKKPSVPQRQGRKSDAISIIKFGKDALKFKNKKGDAVSWDTTMIDEFHDTLRAKLK